MTISTDVVSRSGGKEWGISNRPATIATCNTRENPTPHRNVPWPGRDPATLARSGWFNRLPSYIAHPAKTEGSM
jgi:hypothetical protein